MQPEAVATVATVARLYTRTPGQPEAVATVATVATVAARDAEDRTLPVIAVAVAVAAVAVAVAALRHLDRRVRSQSAISAIAECDLNRTTAYLVRESCNSCNSLVRESCNSCNSLVSESCNSCNSLRAATAATDRRGRS